LAHFQSAKPESESATAAPSEKIAFLGTISVEEFKRVAENMPAEMISFDIRPEDKEAFYSLLDRTGTIPAVE
jgi:hypothetical protein